MPCFFLYFFTEALIILKCRFHPVSSSSVRSSGLCLVSLSPQRGKIRAIFWECRRTAQRDLLTAKISVGKRKEEALFPNRERKEAWKSSLHLCVCVFLFYLFSHKRLRGGYNKKAKGEGGGGGAFRGPFRIAMMTIRQIEFVVPEDHVNFSRFRIKSNYGVNSNNCEFFPIINVQGNKNTSSFE